MCIAQSTMCTLCSVYPCKYLVSDGGDETSAATPEETPGRVIPNGVLRTECRFYSRKLKNLKKIESIQRKRNRYITKRKTNPAELPGRIIFQHCPTERNIKAVLASGEQHLFVEFQCSTSLNVHQLGGSAELLGECDDIRSTGDYVCKFH